MFKNKNIYKKTKKIKSTKSIVHFTDMIQYIAPSQATLFLLKPSRRLKYNLKAYNRFPQVQIQGCSATVVLKK